MIPFTKPRIAVGICVHNEEEYIQYCLNSIYRFADVIAVCVTTGTPWGGKYEEPDNTLNLVKSFPDPDGKIHVLEGEWPDEITQRNANLDLVRDKADYYMIVDADEFYTKESLYEIMNYIRIRPYVGQFRIRVRTYWKTNPIYVIDPPEPLKQYIISRIRKRTHFIDLRKTNEKFRCLIPPHRAILHHLSYARSNEKILHKINNFSHRHQIVDGWYDNVWLKWDEDHSLENLHPTNPPEYKRTIQANVNSLPEAIRNHPYVHQQITVENNQR